MDLVVTDYEINPGTLALIPIDDKSSKVLELDNKELIVNKSTNKIIKENCKMYGCSLQGRLEGASKLLGSKYKNPVIISEINNIIFFPTMSYRDNDCVWISSTNLKDYMKDNNKTIIRYKDNSKLELDCSYYIIDNQVLKSAFLENKLLKLKMN